MKVQKLENGQFEVTHNNLKLVQTIIKGERYNDCSMKDMDGYYELASQNNELFKPLFIALHNYKNEN